MSHPFNDQVEERVYELGYDKGYEDCKSEIMLKLRTAIPYLLMRFCDPKPELDGMYAKDISEKIVREVFGG